jgi:hypothetical protein
MFVSAANRDVLLKLIFTTVMAPTTFVYDFYSWPRTFKQCQVIIRCILWSKYGVRVSILEKLYQISFSYQRLKLQETNTYTIFAPNDTAYDNLTPDRKQIVDDLTATELETLLNFMSVSIVNELWEIYLCSWRPQATARRAHALRRYCSYTIIIKHICQLVDML